MKKILFILMAVLIVSAAYAAPRAEIASQRRWNMVEKYVSRAITASDLDKENEFGDTPVFAAAKKGDVQALLNMQNKTNNGAFLLKTGKDGNNVFHVARNAETFQALARLIRHFYPTEYKAKIHLLMNQRNQLNEMPVQTQINYGHADTFFLAYSYTDLADKIKSVKAKLDKGGLVAEVAQAEVAEVFAQSQDASGRTLAQAARDNHAAAGMDKVVDFLATQAPYL